MTSADHPSPQAVNRFEDLIAWQKARQLTRDVYAATSEGPISRDFALSKQIQRSAVSIMSNIAEGFERSHAREFHQFLAVAKASCAEVRSHFYVALDVGYFSQEVFDRLSKQASEVARIVGGLRVAVERNIAKEK